MDPKPFGPKPFAPAAQPAPGAPEVPAAPVETGPFIACEDIYQADNGNHYRFVRLQSDAPAPTREFVTKGGKMTCNLIAAHPITFDTKALRDAALG